MLFAFLERFTNVLGLPNLTIPSNVCSIPRILAYKDTFGFTPLEDVSKKTKSILLWGYNPTYTRGKIAIMINKAIKSGSKLVVIDPLETPHVDKVHKWLPVRSGTDLVLALGMINIIIQEGWYDLDFINRHIIGFDKLVENVKDYNLDMVADITDLSCEAIWETARLFAQENLSVIAVSNALERNFDCYQANRALAILTAITGNVDLAGSLLPDRLPSDRNLVKNWKLAARHLVDPKAKEKRLGGGYPRLNSFKDVGGQDVISAILTGKPYSVKGGYVLGVNPDVGYISQIDSLLPWRTVINNVAQARN